MRKEVKAVWMACVPERHVNLLGREHIKDIPLRDLNAGDEREEKADEIFKRVALVVRAHGVRYTAEPGPKLGARYTGHVLCLAVDGIVTKSQQLLRQKSLGRKA